VTSGARAIATPREATASVPTTPKFCHAQSKEEPRPICMGPAAALCDEMLLITDKLKRVGGRPACGTAVFELAISDRKQI
jgi:hypothetical protein